MRRTIKLSGLTGNGANGSFSIVMPLGFEYYSLSIYKKSGTVAIANIHDLKLTVNNDVAWNLDGVDIDEINKFDGLPAFGTASCLDLNFECEKFIDGTPRMATSINTLVPSKVTGKVISSFRLEWTMDSATSPSFDVYAEVDNADPVGPGAIQRWRKYTDNLIIGETGTTKLPYGDAKNALWRRLFMKTASAANVTNARILWGSNNEERLNRPKALNDQRLTKYGKVPGPYFNYALDFSETNLPEFWNTSEFMTGDGNLQTLFTSDTAVAGTYYLNSIGEV